MPQFSYKSYCWVVGTTSFRTDNFNYKIERQLALLDEFWKKPENTNSSWRDLQLKYYRFMQECNFVEGDAPNPEKDAREKTSGLKDIGLIDNERKLTNVGKALLAMSQRGDFNRDNPLLISSDSLVYLKQLLKTSISVDGDVVRPFVVTLYMLLKFGNLSYDEFTYLLPLCTNRENTDAIVAAIQKLHTGIGDIDQTIIARLMAMDNYKEALEYFLNERVTEDVIMDIGMNRKSRTYDRPYYKLYELLRAVAIGRDVSCIEKLYEQSRKLNGKSGALWRQYLFGAATRQKLKRDGFAALNDVAIFRAASEHEFKTRFFEQMHLFKAKSNLSDYADLNRRYFKTTEAIVFVDGKVEIDTLPHCWLYSSKDELLSIAYNSSDNLTEDMDFEAIASFLIIDERKIHANLETLYGVSVTDIGDVNRIINDKRYERFHALIEEKFNRAALIDLFEKYERREYDAIRQIVTNNADAPTIFEYLIGIAWYLISDCRGDVLSYMKLSLEADLLPRTHAAGGNADIEYIYPQTAKYPAHTLLIEATLTENTNQRRMEMEPVSRHLGEYILKTGNTNAYCVFVSTFVDINVRSDFRNRRTFEYHCRQYKDVVNGLKILTLETQELRMILKHEIRYEQLYVLFENAFRSNVPVLEWYEQEIKGKLHSLNKQEEQQ